MKNMWRSKWKYIAVIFISVPIFAIILATNKFVAKASDNGVIPKPLNYKKGEGKFLFTKDTSIYVKANNEAETNELYKIAEFFKGKLQPSTGFTLNIVKSEQVPEGNIYLTTIGGEENMENEGYRVIINDKKVKIVAYKPDGISRGIQTLRQLLEPSIEKSTLVIDKEWSISSSEISDKPEYSYRGLMIDVARHFFSVDEIKRQIDLAAYYKVNKVHLHLSDDQGWRLEIKKWPDLTLIGGSTQVGGGPGGYYTQQQFKDIVKYAAERYVEIIPEFDMPGHSNAALASYGFLNEDGKKKPLYTGTKVGFSTLVARDEKTYSFIEDIIKEVSDISPSKYIHIGGDEAQKTKKEDYDYFIGRVSKIVEKHGKTPIGWDPVDTSTQGSKNLVLQNWSNKTTDGKKKRMNTIISVAQKAYLDMKYNSSTPYGLTWAGYIPIDIAYKWDPTDYAQKELLMGLEVPLWTETITDFKAMDYMIYPRLLGYSEIAWTPKENRDWNEYKNRLIAHGERMKNRGINYYRDKRIWIP